MSDVRTIPRMGRMSKSLRSSLNPDSSRWRIRNKLRNIKIQRKRSTIKINLRIKGKRRKSLNLILIMTTDIYKVKFYILNIYSNKLFTHLQEI